jgi:hypothetical protein
LPLLLDNFNALVRTAHFADAVSELEFSALTAFYHARNYQLKVSPTLVAACFGCSSLWYCHSSHLLAIIQKPQAVF